MILMEIEFWSLVKFAETLKIISLCGKSKVTISAISFDDAVSSLQAFKCWNKALFQYWEKINNTTEGK